MFASWMSPLRWGSGRRTSLSVFFVLLHLFLSGATSGSTSCSSGTPDEAGEVDENTFFYSKQSGGTVVPPRWRRCCASSGSAILPMNGTSMPRSVGRRRISQATPNRLPLPSSRRTDGTLPILAMSRLSMSERRRFSALPITGLRSGGLSHRRRRMAEFSDDRIAKRRISTPSSKTLRKHRKSIAQVKRGPGCQRAPPQTFCSKVPTGISRRWRAPTMPSRRSRRRSRSRRIPQSARDHLLRQMLMPTRRWACRSCNQHWSFGKRFVFEIISIAGASAGLLMSW